MLRLRVTVQRHALPALNIIWSVPATASPQAYTIARLLEDINNVVPLEADDWGLDDYAVEVGGFECLHFSPVLQSLKDDDHLTIRPLLTAEVRARTLSGRLQISEGGQHLVDGIPFGRPYLRTPNRPPVGIPPRKKQRLLEETPFTSTALTTAASERASPRQDSSAGAQSERSGSSDKVVRFQEPVTNELGSSEEDEDFVPDDMEMDNISDDASDEPPSESEASNDTESSIVSSDSDASDSAADSDSDAESDSDDSTSDSDSSSESSDSDSDERIEMLKMGPPGRGTKKTQNRNQRRRESNALKRLIKEGTLPENATLADLRLHQNNPPKKDVKEKSKVATWENKMRSTIKAAKMNGALESAPIFHDDLSMEQRREVLLAQLGLDEPVDDPAIAGTLAHGDISDEAVNDHAMENVPDEADLDTAHEAMEIMEKTKTLEHAHIVDQSLSGQDEASKQEKGGRFISKEIADIVDNIKTNTANGKESRGVSPKPSIHHHANQSDGNPIEEANVMNDGENNGAPDCTPVLTATPALRRLTVNTAAFARILRQKTTHPGKNPPGKGVQPRSTSRPETETGVQVGKNTDPDLWKSTIKLSAFECWHEDVELSAPPFPFKQDWDESVKSLRDKSKKNKNKNKKRRITYDELSTVDGGPSLDYDDYGENDTAAIETQIVNDVNSAPSSPIDFPDLPADLGTLPDLQHGDVKKGAFIVFKYLKVDFSFNGPEMSGFVTACILEEGDSGGAVGMIPLQLAQRDIEKPKVEEKGRNGKRKFGLLHTGGEEAEDGMLSLDFIQLMEAKLLQAGPA
ncbi:hypothetical protein P154DRAFT_517682 [Amniculicola lignicola CBS 123094]|uniref:DUF7357 domain-containing protein n=1 Tax=Amniculicola lignicola CBS 123094 TaxID=1392246 RepID=A0A6A5X270_9PLEO|nr:hypothetical protein P154DRAFT_517682 [Amniculicola lignicola CBS 123094]